MNKFLSILGGIIILVGGYFIYDKFNDLKLENELLREQLVLSQEDINRLDKELLESSQDLLMLGDSLDKSNLIISSLTKDKIEIEDKYKEELSKLVYLSDDEHLDKLKRSLPEDDRYPERMVIDRDTLIAITPIQVREVNSIIVERNFYSELSVNNELVIENLLRNVDIYRRIVNSLNIQVETLRSQRDNEISEKNRVLIELGQEKEKSTRLGLQRNISVGVSVVSIVALILL